MRPDAKPRALDHRATDARRVLIVEGATPHTDALASELRGEGHAIERARDSTDAIERLESGAFDALVVFVGEGTERLEPFGNTHVCHALRAIVAIASSLDRPVVAALLRLGFTDVFCAGDAAPLLVAHAVRRDGAPAISPAKLAPTPGPSFAAMAYADARRAALVEFERGYVRALLADAAGNISLAARRAGLDRSNFKRIARRAALDAQSRRASSSREPADRLATDEADGDERRR